MIGVRNPKKTIVICLQYILAPSSSFRKNSLKVFFLLRFSFGTDGLRYCICPTEPQENLSRKRPSKHSSRPLAPKVLLRHLGRGENSSESALGHLSEGENSSESVLEHL